MSFDLFIYVEKLCVFSKLQDVNITLIGVYSHYSCIGWNNSLPVQFGCPHNQFKLLWSNGGSNIICRVGGPWLLMSWMGKDHRVGIVPHGLTPSNTQQVLMSVADQGGGGLLLRRLGLEPPLGNPVMVCVMKRVWCWGLQDTRLSSAG